MKWRPALWLVALAVVIADQATKQWALETLVPYEKHEVLGEFLQIQLVFNSGAAFSLGENNTWIMTIVALAITVALVVYARRAQTTATMWIFGIGLGGAIGNLIDRLFREPSFGQGHVVDMINYNNWFVGNVADIAIVGAAAALLVMAMLGKPILSPEDHASEATASATGKASESAGDAPEPEQRDAEASHDRAATSGD